MKNLAMMMHLLICNKKHSKDHDIKEDECGWYIEDQIESCWEQPDHKEYLEQAEVLTRLIMIDPREDITEKDIKKSYNILVEISNICQKISFLIENIEGLNSIVYKSILKVLQS